jgi:hypothetical protein
MRNDYKPGSWNATCDRCGFKFKAEDLVKEWTGLMVCKQDYEPRHPSDLFRVPKEDTAVPWSRPEPTWVFLTSNLESQSSENLLTESGDNLVW